MSKPKDADECSRACGCYQDICADGVRVARPLFFQMERGGSIPTSALDLKFEQIGLEYACRLNRKWHSRLPIARPGNMQVYPSICYSAENGGVIYAIAIWARPIARMLNDKPWIELRRFAISPESPKNTASRMLAWMCRDVKKRFPHLEKAISYQDMESHDGTIYRAAGWSPTRHSSVSATGWQTRPNNNVMQTTADKIRWERDLS